MGRGVGKGNWHRGLLKGTGGRELDAGNRLEGTGGRDPEGGNWRQGTGSRELEAGIAQSEGIANNSRGTNVLQIAEAIYVSHCPRTRRHKTETIALMSLALTSLDGGPGWARV